MMKTIIIMGAVFLLSGCAALSYSKSKKEDACGDACRAQSGSEEMACKLTTPELRSRKNTVLASLRKQVIQKKELPNGYAYKFIGTDKMLDELNEFIKTERQCCSFFTFNLSISGDQSEVWLELTGAEGAKNFIKTELEL